MKSRNNLSKQLLVASALTCVAFALTACDSSVPGKKSVTPRPVEAANKVEPAGAKFKGGDTMQSTDKISKDGDTKGDTKK